MHRPAQVSTYTAIVDACAKAGDVKRGEKWMEKMLACGIAAGPVGNPTLTAPNFLLTELTETHSQPLIEHQSMLR